eukprot:scaffold4705_cov108-Cylindrotheca_fusiformis.AAC.4
MLATLIGRINYGLIAKQRCAVSRLAAATRTTNRSHSTTTTVPLHVEAIGDSKEKRSTVFLHGLLGNGRNLKTFAKNVCQATNTPGYLVDLRGHGQSRLNSSTTTVTESSFAAFVQDVAEATKDLSMTSIVGHSLGGRIALQHAAMVAADDSSLLQRVWLLDTVPGQADESVERVIDTVSQLSKELETTTLDRKQVRAKLSEKGLDAGIAAWLASSFDGKDFGFDLSVVHDIMPEFEIQNFYGLLQHTLSKNVRVDLVRGGKNKGWTMDTLRQLEYIQGQFPEKFGIHVLPKASHWVHVDDMKGLVEIIADH